jgi:hypothetical protein
MTSRPPRSSAPSAPTLAEDSLAHALATAAHLIADVVAGAISPKRWRPCGARPATPPGVRGAILDLTYGTLRDYGRQDFILASCCRSPA